jgi:quinol monooxygenase YgiN
LEGTPEKEHSRGREDGELRAMRGCWRNRLVEKEMEWKSWQVSEEFCDEQTGKVYPNG